MRHEKMIIAGVSILFAVIIVTGGVFMSNVHDDHIVMMQMLENIMVCSKC